jgi:hypothetical protein
MLTIDTKLFFKLLKKLIFHTLLTFILYDCLVSQSLKSKFE